MKERNLQTIFTEYRDKVYGFFVSSLGDRELAADLTQDLFFRLCKKSDTLHEIRNINAYIYWMAQNMVIDHLRRAASEKEYREKLIVAWKNSGTSSAFYQQPEIESEMDREHFNELFDQLIHDLTPQQQLIITLSKKDGLSNKKIAQKLGLSPQTVKNHLHQALKTLRTQLDPDVDYTILFWVLGASVFLYEIVG